eukprot:522016-Alexandrium_andersonii.AAC.1
MQGRGRSASALRIRPLPTAVRLNGCSTATLARSSGTAPRRSSPWGRTRLMHGGRRACCAGARS